MCVIVGLFFFALAIFTFLLCSWNPKISNTARLHLCLNLSLSHLLLLWNDRYIEHEVGIEMQCIRNEQINMIWLIIWWIGFVYFSTVSLYRYGRPSPLFSRCKFCVDAAGSATAPPVSPKTNKSASHSERWSPQATSLPDWLWRSIYDCGCFCTGVFWWLWCYWSKGVSRNKQEVILSCIRFHCICHASTLKTSFFTYLQMLALWKTIFQMGSHWPCCCNSWSEYVAWEK